MIKLNIDIDSQIDPNNLDLEWREQPHMFSLYARKHAEAIKNKRLVKKQVTKELRDNWDKATQGSISATAMNAEIKINEEYIEAEYQCNVAEGDVNAMDQKKRALEGLIKLGGMEYFSMPRESRELSRQWDRAASHKEVSQKVSNALNKPRRTV